MKHICLDGVSLTRDQLVMIANGATVELDDGALEKVARAAGFLAEQVRREEPIYGVSTGFGSNADKLLGDKRYTTGELDCDGLLAAHEDELKAYIARKQKYHLYE